MKMKKLMATWLVVTLVLITVIGSDARRVPGSRDEQSDCRNKRKSCLKKRNDVSCGDYVLEPDSELEIFSSSQRTTNNRRSSCRWSVRTQEDHTLRVVCERPTDHLTGTARCRTSNLRISDGERKHTRICGKETLARLTSKTGKLLLVEARLTARSRSKPFFNYRCKVTSVGGSLTRNGTTTTDVPEPTSPTPRCKCGRPNRKRRIVGGTQVEPNEYPWHVGLLKKNSSRPFCGGSIIADSWVLTAAHCLLDLEVEDLTVLVGEHDWSTTQETSVTKKIKAKYMVKHPYFFMRKPLKDDIALIQLVEPLEFPEDNSVAPVCLAKPNRDYPKNNAMVVGWGTTEEKLRGLSKFLRVAEVQTMTNSVCQGLTPFKGGIPPGMICAGHLFSGEIACHGDSGGALLTRGESCGGKCLEHIGVVSWGAFCSKGVLPTVYTRTNHHLGWINMFIGGSKTCQLEE